MRHSIKQAAVSPLQKVSKRPWHIQECSCSGGPHAWREAVQQDGNLAFLQGYEECTYMLQLRTSQHIIGVLGYVLGSSQPSMHGASATCTRAHVCCRCACCAASNSDGGQLRTPRRADAPIPPQGWRLLQVLTLPGLLNTRSH